MLTKFRVWLIRLLAGSDQVAIGLTFGKEGAALTTSAEKNAFVYHCYFYNQDIAVRIELPEERK